MPTISGEDELPEISRFFGIVIAMYYTEHDPPHFHAAHGGRRASFEIDSGRVRGQLFADGYETRP